MWKSPHWESKCPKPVFWNYKKEGHIRENCTQLDHCQGKVYVVNAKEAHKNGKNLEEGMESRHIDITLYMYVSKIFASRYDKKSFFIGMVYLYKQLVVALLDYGYKYTFLSINLENILDLHVHDLGYICNVCVDARFSPCSYYLLVLLNDKPLEHIMC